MVTTATVEHVVLLVADEWRGDTLGCLGTPGVSTPHLDALAADGVLLANHWCEASPCGPSRASLLYGTQVAGHQQWTNAGPAPNHLPSLAALCRAAGMRPRLVGYTDTPVGEELHDTSFDLVREFFWQRSFPEYRAELARRGYRSLPEEMMGIYAPAGPPDHTGLSPSVVADSDSDVTWLTDAAVAEVERIDSPTLLHVNWLRPHPPFAPPAPYHRLVDPDAVALPERSLSLEDQRALHPHFDQATRRGRMTEYVQRPLTVDQLTERDERLSRAAYYGHCAQVDAAVGRIVAALEERDLVDRTLLIFCSDHGDALGDDWLWGRRGPGDGHFRVPGIIADPRLAPERRGTRIDRFTANIDLAPTVLEAIGAERPDHLDGRSLGPLLSDPEGVSWRDHVRYDMDWTDHAGTGRTERFSAIRTATHRFVEFSGCAPLLFDLVDDPGQSRNLATDPARASLVADLQSLLR